MALQAVAAQAGITAAKTAGSYFSEVIAGHMGYRTLTSIKDNCASTGFKYAGKVGGFVGGLFGKALAGNTLPAIKTAKNEIAGSLNAVTSMAIDATRSNPAPAVAAQAPAAVAQAENVAQPQNSGSWTSTALKIAKATAIVGGGLVVAANILPVASTALAYAAMTAVPNVIAAATEEVKNCQNVDLIDDVAKPVFKQMLINGISLGAANIVRYNTIEGAYNLRVKEFKEIGKAIGSYLPASVSAYFVKAGEIVGHVDAGRYAMTDAMIEQAIANGENAQSMVSNGLKIADAVISPNTPATSGWMNGVRKAAWVGAGAIGTIAVFTLCPEATLVLAPALLGVADQGVRYLKGRICTAPAAQPQAAESEAPKAVETEAEKVKTEVNKLNEVLTASHKPVAPINLATSMIAASAAA